MNARRKSRKRNTKSQSGDAPVVRKANPRARFYVTLGILGIWISILIWMIRQSDHLAN